MAQTQQPPDYTEHYNGAGQLWNVDPLLLRSIAQAESGEGRDTSTSSAGAQGYMQFIPETAAKYNVDVNDPKSSIYGAARYMDDLLQYYGGDLHAALSAYGGDKTGKGYADRVLTNYRALQGQQANAPPGADDTGDLSSAAGAAPTSGDIQGVRITAKALPASGGAGPGGANFKPPPQAPAYFGGSDAPGARAQHVIADNDVSNLFGTSTGVAPSGTTPGAAPQKPAPPDNDVTHLFGKPEAAGAAGPQPQPVTGIDPLTGNPLEAPASQAQPQPTNTIEGAPIVQLPPPSWWETNVAAPVRQMYNPLTADAPPMNYLLGSPILQKIGAGFLQGPRDVTQRGNEFASWADQNSPFLASVDRYFGRDPAAAERSLAAETAQNQQQYPSSLAFSGGRLGGDIAATYPLSPAARVIGRAAEAVPLVSRLAPVTEMAAVPAGQNVMTTPGEDWRTAGEQGAVGGLTVGSVLGSPGAGLVGARAATPITEMADRLGIRLSAGQRQGGILQRIEDTSSVIPGSGATRFAQQQRGDIAQVLAREAGIPGDVAQIDTVGLNAARQAAGQRIEDAASRIGVPSNTTLVPDLQRIITNATQAGVSTPQAQTAANLAQQLGTLIQNNNGVLPGAQFQKFIARGGPLDVALGSSVPEVRAVGQATREALLNAAQTGGTGASAAATQQALQDLAQARYQYKVIRTIEPAITRTPTGTEEMSLPGLAQHIRNGFDMTQTGPGNNMQDLARLIGGPMRTLPSSGTSERALWQRMLGLGPEALGGSALAYMAPNVVDQALGGAVPFGAAALAGRASRYGSGLGLTPVEAARQLFNPLMPRLAGPRVGNLLLPDQRQQQ